MANTLHAFKCGSLVFSFNTNSHLVADWLACGRATHDFRPTLIRAVLRWAMRRDGVALADLESQQYGRGCQLYKDSNGAFRFTVRYPWGVEFSNAFVQVLKDLGYGVVSGPAFNFDDSDTAEWYASKNRAHLDEMGRLLEDGDTWDEAFYDALEARVEELGDVTAGLFDWKNLQPDECIAYLAERFGIKIRWFEGERFHKFTRGSHGWYHFLIEP